MGGKEVTEQTLDPYARPYIPQDLIRANHAPALLTQSTPAAEISFSKYRATFTGTEFLSCLTNWAYYHTAEPRFKHNDGSKTSQLSSDTYANYFSTVLAREATVLQSFCNDHALYNVPISRSELDPRTNMFDLSVPGLREQSLPMEIGDAVHIRQLIFAPTGELIQHPSPLYPAYTQINAVVWGVNRQRETLSLRIDNLFWGSGRFNVCFSIQSCRLNAMQGAVDLTDSQLRAQNRWFYSMVFPQAQDGVLQTELKGTDRPLTLFDDQMNYEQLKTVRAILRQDYGQVPYLVTGPPGTGKTKTVVETALQFISANEKVSDPAELGEFVAFISHQKHFMQVQGALVDQLQAHLLICAPSDPACDTLVQRLSRHLDPKQLLRLNASTRSFPEVPNNILQYCHVEGEIFSLPPVAQLMQKRVVVVTCRDAAMLLKGSLSNRDLYSLESRIHASFRPDEPPLNPSYHWDGMIIDEAAQAMESEAMLSVLVVAPPHATTDNPKGAPFVVMVGDQHQLGPRTASKDPAIQQSMFERLLRRPLYQDHPLARSRQSGGAVPRLTKDMLPMTRPPFTDLIRNYRSHPAIIALPSSLFYHDTLESEAASTDSLLSWSRFETRPFPVLFIDNCTPDEIERDGGGWFNVGEADIALQHAASLLQEGLLAPHEICIMSPFSAQVRLLRLKARSPSVNVPGINIGPLEAFQGLESRAVILCTTRTRDRFIDQDLARGLGIINEPRRFNVALTRAKEGLIVIGSSKVLMQDENWASFMAFCHRNDAWKGDSDDLHWPHSSKIKTSRLEKQMQYRGMLEEEERKDRVRRHLGLLKLGMSEEEAFYESGIAAQQEVGVPEDDEGADDDYHEEIGAAELKVDPPGGDLDEKNNRISTLDPETEDYCLAYGLE